jgi:hypothetical protein
LLYVTRVFAEANFVFPPPAHSVLSVLNENNIITRGARFRRDILIDFRDKAGSTEVRRTCYNVVSYYVDSVERRGQGVASKVEIDGVSYDGGLDEGGGVDGEGKGGGKD